MAASITSSGQQNQKTIENQKEKDKEKEQLLVCWLEPQSDSGKVSAIPANWIVSIVSGDGKSPESVVKCRWPRTKRLYRAKIVSTATLEPKQDEDAGVVDDQDAVESDSGRKIKKEDEMVKEESTKSNRLATITPSGTSATSPAVTTASTTSILSALPHLLTTSSQSHQHSQPTSPAVVTEATALAQALLPTLKKLFNQEISKLSTDIQANFDIIGHKISALDGTVKCIKTRVDRMETLLNTAAQELGDNQPSTPTSTATQAALATSATPASVPTPMSASLSMSAPSQSSISRFSSVRSTSFGIPAARSSVRRARNSGRSVFGLPVRRSNPNPNPNRSVASMPRDSAGRFLSRHNPTSPTAQEIFRAQLEHHRKQQQAALAAIKTQAGIGNRIPTTSSGNGNAIISTYPRPNMFQTPPTSTSTSSQSIPNFTSLAATAAAAAAATSAAAKRRRPTPATTSTFPLPKAVVITAPNGIEVYLGGDKNYKMPLVNYKDALKNCTKPSATYMVMALIRRYLSADEMSRTWLTEQQLLGKKDGILLDQLLLTALKKQALMQFPNSGIDDRLLIRKLYDVFHGIRRQIRKKRRMEAVKALGFGTSLLNFGSNGTIPGLGDDDADSGSGMDDDDSPNMGEGFDDETGNDFDDEIQTDQMKNSNDEEVESGGNRLNIAQQNQEAKNDHLLAGDDVAIFNGDEDLEAMAEKQAAFWAGAEESY